MKRLRVWSAAVIVSIAMGGVYGFLLERTVSWLSRGYRYCPEDPLFALGLRAGLLTGTVLAACAVIGTREPVALRRLAFAVLGLASAVTGTAIALAAMAYVAAKSGVLQSGEYPLPGSARHAVCCGMEWGSAIGLVGASLAATTMLWLGRKART